jgi:translocator protein
VLGLRKGPLLAAVALPVLFAVFGTALVGGSGLEWYEGLEKPGFLVPLGIFYLVGALYYALFAVVVYRVLARVDDPRGRTLSLGLTVGVMLLNELWNYGFFGLRSTLAGFLGILVFLGAADGAGGGTAKVRGVLGGAACALLRVGVVRRGLDLRAVEAQLSGASRARFPSADAAFRWVRMSSNFAELRYGEVRRIPTLRSS